MIDSQTLALLSALGSVEGLNASAMALASAAAEVNPAGVPAVSAVIGQLAGAHPAALAFKVLSQSATGSVKAARTANLVCFGLDVTATLAELGSTILTLTGKVGKEIDTKADIAGISLDGAGAVVDAAKLVSSVTVKAMAKAAIAEGRVSEGVSMGMKVAEAFDLVDVGLFGVTIGLRAANLVDIMSRQKTTCSQIMTLSSTSAVASQTQATSRPSNSPPQNRTVDLSCVTNSSSGVCQSTIPLLIKNASSSMEGSVFNFNPSSFSSLSSGIPAGQVDQIRQLSEAASAGSAEDKSKSGRSNQFNAYLSKLLDKVDKRISNNIKNSISGLAVNAFENPDLWKKSLNSQLKIDTLPSQISPLTNQVDLSSAQIAITHPNVSTVPPVDDFSSLPIKETSLTEVQIEIDDIWHTNSKKNIFEIVTRRIRNDLSMVELLEFYIPLNRALVGLPQIKKR